MSLTPELRAMEFIQQLHAFLVEPVKAKKGYHDSKGSYTWMSDRIDTTEGAAEHNGKILEFYADGSVLIEQESSRVEQDGELATADTPIKWMMKVSKTEVKLHLPSLDQVPA